MSLGYTVLEWESDKDESAGPALCHIFQLKQKKMSDNGTLLLPRTPEGRPLDDDFTMYNIERNPDLDEESPPGSKLEPRHKAKRHSIY